MTSSQQSQRTFGNEEQKKKYLPRIAKGAPADLCLVDLEAAWEVGEHGYESRSENCCFAGRTLRGKVLVTVAAGSVVYRERTFALSAA